MIQSLSPSLLLGFMLALAGASVADANVALRSSSDLLRGSDLLGMKIEGVNAKKKPAVQDAILDLGSGKILFLVVSQGGYFSFGEKLVGIPPQRFEIKDGGRLLQMDASSDQIKHAPKVDPSRWNEEVRDPGPLSEIYRAFGDAEPRETTHDRKEKDPTPDHAQWQIRRAEKLIGMKVVSKAGERLGEVEDFLVSLPSGELVVIVFGSEKYMRPEGSLISLPPSKLRAREGVEGLLYEGDPAELEKAPHFSVSQWPDFAQEDYMRGVYGAFGMPGTFPSAPLSTSTSKDNHDDHVARDTTSSGPTAEMQSNDERDLAITREIRRSITRSDSSSFAAENIQIITRAGRVTLRGTVANDGERQNIEREARRIAGAGNVQNQLTLSTQK